MADKIPPRIAARAQEMMREIFSLFAGWEGPPLSDGRKRSNVTSDLIAAALLAQERETREADCAAIKAYYRSLSPPADFRRQMFADQRRGLLNGLDDAVNAIRAAAEKEGK